jgi:hypothetical protein
MHPSPGRPQPDCGSAHQQRRRKKDSCSEAAVEPASEKEKEQRRHDDGPAENADLPQPRTERGLGICATLRGALNGSSRGASQAIEISFAQDTASRSIDAGAKAGLGRR